MKPKFRNIFLAASALLSICSTYAADTDGTWTKNATGTQNWGDGLNWSGGCRAG